MDYYPLCNLKSPIVITNGPILKSPHNKPLKPFEITKNSKNLLFNFSQQEIEFSNPYSISPVEILGNLGFLLQCSKTLLC
ncbi:hypothetical protein M5689_004702 [Euphorbia peplus]|nr:hypothetical protein M5689_004702 [Euphorbia peplus]